MPDIFSRYANPARFLKVTGPMLPWLGGISALFIALGTVWALGFSPADAKQGDSVRMMYVHVPAAWMAMFVYGLMAAASITGFVWRHQLADIAAREAAPMGAAFTFLALVTGSIWGKVTWGVWWDWDPRLVSMLVLLFIYLGYIALWRAIDNPPKAARPAALLCIIGAVNLPIIKFSVDFWDTLHQKASVIRAGGPAMPASMLWPLLVIALGVMALFAFYLILRIRTVVLEKQAAPASDAPAPSRATLSRSAEAGGKA